ncbi:hypothetical protein JG688_00012023 [Phytophthora aleatoria]|uniref:Uncharacterized protein n=1 Tax=Phytophthora aleatoria TaxID=2496075 RepID=A0A8J5J393_9STRA|nr:hypothetical protein JG688_00012023 [Phytophthora aleatoria]
MGRWLTIKQKRCIIEKSMECPRMTHSVLAGWATETFKLSLPLPRSTPVRRRCTFECDDADCEP